MIRPLLCLAALLALLAGTAGAEDKYRFFPRKAQPEKAGVDHARSIRQVSFGPEFGDEKPVPRAAAKSGRVASNLVDPPLLLGPTTAGAAIRLDAPPEPTPAQTPGSPLTSEEVTPVPLSEFEVPSGGTSVSLLYPNVRYKDLKNVAPCAVPMVVAVADPCRNCGCVYVQICVPPNCCPKIKCKHGGREVEYKYGDYEIEIKSKNGCVEVDYDD